MDGVIDHTEDALRSVAQLIEPARVNKATKHGINLANRIMWVFRDNPQVRDRHQRLEVCHQSLTTVISCLYSKDLVVIAPVAEPNTEERPPPYDPQMQEFFAWRNRRKSRTILREREIKRVGSPSSMSSSGTTGLSPKGLEYLSPQLSRDEEALNTPPAVSELQSQSRISSTFESEPKYGSSNTLFVTPARAEELNGRPHYNTTNSFSSCDEIPSPPPTAHTHLQNRGLPFTFALPEIDTHPFATMIAYQPLHDSTDGLEIHNPYPVHNEAMLWDKQSQHSTTGSAASSSPASDANARSSGNGLPSELSWISLTSFGAGQSRKWDWPESSKGYQYNQPDLTEPQELDQQPQTFTDMGTGSTGTVQQQYHSELPSSVPSPVSEQDGPQVTGQGSIRRGGPSWLAWHATRSDMGHGMGSERDGG